jgi:hypothetical protein
MNAGFVKLPRSLEELLLAGQLGLFELGVYAVIYLQANPSSGIWHGSATRIVSTVPRKTTRRAVQRALAHLAAQGLLRIFRRPGARGNYVVLVEGYPVTVGPQAGRRLRAGATTDWRHPVYVAGTGAVTEAVTEAVTDAVTPEQQDRDAEREEPPPAAFAGTHLWLSLEDDRRLAAAFPHADRAAAYRRMDAWLAERNWRPANALRFARSWLGRERAPAAEAAAGFNPHDGADDGPPFSAAALERLRRRFAHGRSPTPAPEGDDAHARADDLRSLLRPAD